MSITTLFDDFFKLQPIHIQETAACCKRCKLDNWIDVCVALCAYLCFDPKDEPHGIRFEFVKAFAYHICKINNTLP